VVLAAQSAGFELVGLDGGYALAVAAPGGTSWSVHLFDVKLDPVAPPVAIGTTAGPVVMRGVGTGSVAWFVWQRGGAAPPLGLQGASVDLANPANVVAITGLTQPGSLQAAWPADGGIGFAEWSTRSGAPDLRFLVPPQARFASVYEVSLSSRSQVLSFAGRYFTDDAGTSDFGDGVLWFASSRRGRR
jgi:hypothetical protein